MEVLIVRHGQSQADLEDRHEGRADFPLTDLGKEQARLAAKWILNNYPPELIFSSPLERAWQTATLISEMNGVSLIKEEALLEWDNGLLAGLLREEAAKLYPKPTGGRKAHHKMAKTESLIEFRARAEMFWSSFREEYLEKGSHKRIALVSHGGMINMLFHCFLELPIESNIIFSSGDTGIHLWRLTPQERRVVFTNKLDHLVLSDLC